VHAIVEELAGLIETHGRQSGFQTAIMLLLNEMSR
jgi:hypothetical protein